MLVITRALDIDDGERLVDVGALDLGASGHDQMHTALILLHMELEHALLVGQLMDALQIDSAQVLDEDRAALRCLGWRLNNRMLYTFHQLQTALYKLVHDIAYLIMSGMLRQSGAHHFVCFMVALGI